ncbi:MAG: hypothetical protein AAGF33_11960 [Pseudomonadota bacterium]
MDKELKGKKFNPAAKIDPEKEYGKEVFANSVVKSNAGKIDFSGFDPLLDRIVGVINHYSSCRGLSHKSRGIQQGGCA